MFRLALFFSLVLLAASCQKRRPAIVLSSPASVRQLEGTWLSAHEENHGDTLVYRPNTYHFPPTRGRTGFAIGPFGRFKQFDIAPADGLASRSGTWTADGDSRLRIHLTDRHDPDYTLDVLSFTPQVLKVRRH